MIDMEYPPRTSVEAVRTGRDHGEIAAYPAGEHGVASRWTGAIALNALPEAGSSRDRERSERFRGVRR